MPIQPAVKRGAPWKPTWYVAPGGAAAARATGSSFAFVWWRASKAVRRDQATGLGELAVLGSPAIQGAGLGRPCLCTADRINRLQKRGHVTETVRVGHP